MQFFNAQVVSKAIRSGWLFVDIGLIGLYGSTYWDLAHSTWQTEEQFHGPMILLVAFGRGST